MENYVVVSKHEINEQDLRKLVEGFGGLWFTDAGEYGIIQCGEARLEVDTADLHDYAPQELEALRRILGGDPASCVGVAYSTNVPSEILAKQFCSTLIEAFGGFLDDNFSDIV